MNRRRNVRTALLALAFGALPLGTYAADVVFNGSTSTDRNTPTNWNAGVPPGFGGNIGSDNALINDGKTADINASLTNGTITGIYIGADGPAPTATTGDGTVTQENQALTVTGNANLGG